MNNTDKQYDYLQKQIRKLENQIIEERKKHKKQLEDSTKGSAWLLAIVIGLAILLGLRMDRRHQSEIAYEREIAVQEYIESLY